MLEAIKTLQLVAQAADFKFESKFEPMPVIWQSLQRLFQKVIEGLEGKINGQALGAALLLCLRGPDWPAQIQGISDEIPSRLQSLRAATGSFEVNLLPLSRY